LILQNLSLGKTPPIVTMVRLLDETVEGDDLVSLFLDLGQS
jgi:hypothetical protein